METRYRQEGDAFLIEIKLSDVRQMFNSLDPAPFLEKDLDEDAQAYIVDSAREFHLKTPLKLVLHVPEAQAAEVSRHLPEAVHNYFAYRAEIAQKEFKFTLRQGRWALLIGLLFLVLCLSLSEMAAQIEHGTIARILQEGLLIMGWVAMWRPVQIFLYDWWPLRLQRRVLEKLQQIPIEIRART